MLSKYILIGAAVVILILGFTVKFLYSENSQLQKNIATSEANVEKLKGTVSEQNKSILRLETTRNEDQKRMIELSEKAYKNRIESERIKKIFKKHDINGLSLAKPGLMENIINKGTKKVKKEFEELTQ